MIANFITMDLFFFQVQHREDGTTRNINGMFKAKPIQTSQVRKEKKHDEENWKVQKALQESEERKKAEELERIQRNEELKRQRKEEQKKKNEEKEREEQRQKIMEEENRKKEAELI